MNGAVMNPHMPVRLTWGSGGIPILGEIVEGGVINWYGRCKICHCTELDCQRCIDVSGEPCSWANEERTLCTRCVGAAFRSLTEEEAHTEDAEVTGAVPSPEDCTP